MRGFCSPSQPRAAAIAGGASFGASLSASGQPGFRPGLFASSIPLFGSRAFFISYIQLQPLRVAPLALKASHLPRNAKMIEVILVGLVERDNGLEFCDELLLLSNLGSVALPPYLAFSASNFRGCRSMPSLCNVPCRLVRASRQNEQHDRPRQCGVAVRGEIDPKSHDPRFNPS